MDTAEIITNFRILTKTNNMMVINMPPNYEGELVKSEIENLMRVSDALNIRREL